jgi:hypothetical protein
MQETSLSDVGLDRENIAAAGRTDHADRKLRIGLFADAPLQPRWVVEAFAKVLASGCAEVVAIAVGEEVLLTQPWSWRAYCRLDSWLFGSRPDPAERVDLRTLVPDAYVLGLPAGDCGREAEIVWRAKLAGFRLDVAFALGDVDDRVLERMAKHGIWRYCFGPDGGSLEPTLAAFREVSGGAPVTASGLRVRRGPREERLVYQSWSRTLPYSVERTRAPVLRKSAQFVDRALRELHRAGPVWLDGCAPAGRARPHREERLPGRFGLTRDLCRLGGRIARRGLQKLLYVEQWFIGYQFSGSGPWHGDLRGFTHLMPPRDRLWADPFPLERGGRHYIFFEEFVFAAGKANIAMVEVDRSGAASPPVRVLERGYHLSYPFLLEHDGELFMIPESGANQTVELYRCVGFPNRWRLEKVLLRDGWFVDATIHRAADRWWMFANVGVPLGPVDDELHLYYADDLLGEWHPHPANPVKSDARSARPAGRLFELDGALYRPAQIAGPVYGSGVSINRVRKLTPGEYAEQEVERVLPLHPAGLLGIHTLNRAGDLRVLDGFMRRARVGRMEAFVRAPDFARAPGAKRAAPDVSRHGGA